MRAELLTLARQRLPFAFYAVLRRLVRAISPTAQVTLCASDGGVTTGLISNPGSPTRPWLGGLVEVLVLTMSRLSQELSLSAERLCSLDASMTAGTGPGNSNAGLMSLLLKPTHHFQLSHHFELPPCVLKCSFLLL